MSIHDKSKIEIWARDWREEDWPKEPVFTLEDSETKYVKIIEVHEDGTREQLGGTL